MTTVPSSASPTLESVVPEVARLILLHVHPNDAVHLAATSRPLRHLYRCEDTNLSFARAHLLHHFDAEHLLLHPHDTRWDDLANVPFRSLPFAYALALTAVFGRRAFKNVYHVASGTLARDDYTRELRLGPLPDPRWAERLFRKAAVLDLLDLTDVRQQTWTLLAGFAAEHDLVDFLDGLPPRWKDTVREEDYYRSPLDFFVEPVQTAACKGSAGVLLRLLQMAMEVFGKEASKDLTHTAFLAAAECENVAIWDLLFSTYPDHDIIPAGYSITLGYTTAISCWARSGNATMVKRLLSLGAQPTSPAVSRYYPLHEAAYSGSTETAAALLDAGADANILNSRQISPLLLAATHGHVDMIKLLVARGADIEARRAGQENALYAAAFHGHLPAMQTLLDLGADPASAFPQRGRQKSCLNALGHASRAHPASTAIPDLVAMVDAVVARAPHLVPNHSFSLLSSAQHPALVRALVRHGANVNARNPVPIGPPTLLHALVADPNGFHPDACEMTVALVEALVEAGAEMDARDKALRTPLRVLAMRREGEECARVARVLVEAGADVFVRDAEGMNAVEFVRALGIFVPEEEE
ncbi:hypothetical protein HDU96_005531 [Phlyctochytrium bullatum]|nr:hypothetical protein HDU96_005531 [Phlyctochytrium bullatum]